MSINGKSVGPLKACAENTNKNNIVKQMKLYKTAEYLLLLNEVIDLVSTVFGKLSSRSMG